MLLFFVYSFRRHTTRQMQVLRMLLRPLPAPELHHAGGELARLALRTGKQSNVVSRGWSSSHL